MLTCCDGYPVRSMLRHYGSGCCALWFEGDASGVVDAVEEEVQAVGGDVFVDGLAGALPVAVVIQDEDAAADEARVEMLHLVLRRFVPVGVETENGDLLGD